MVVGGPFELSGSWTWDWQPHFRSFWYTFTVVPRNKKKKNLIWLSCAIKLLLLNVVGTFKISSELGVTQCNTNLFWPNFNSFEVTKIRAKNELILVLTTMTLSRSILGRVIIISNLLIFQKRQYKSVVLCSTFPELLITRKKQSF